MGFIYPVQGPNPLITAPIPTWAVGSTENTAQSYLDSTEHSAHSYLGSTENTAHSYLGSTENRALLLVFTKPLITGW